MSTNVTTMDTCPINIELSKHLFLIPAVIILLILAFLNKRKHFRTDILGGRFALVIPYDFLGFDSNRFSIVAIFGTVAGMVFSVVMRVVRDSETNQWSRAFRMIGECLEVAVLSYPMFACLSTPFKVIGSIMGLLYTTTMFAVSLVQNFSPSCQTPPLGLTIVGELPVLLCYVFVLGKYLVVLFFERRETLWNIKYEDENAEKGSRKGLTKPWLVQHVTELLHPRFQMLETKCVSFLRRFYSPERNFHFSVQTLSVLLICSLFLYAITLGLIYIGSSTINKSDHDYHAIVTNALQCSSGVSTMLGASLIISAILSGLLCSFSLMRFMDSHKNNMLRMFKGDTLFIPSSFSKYQTMVGKSMKYAGFQIAFFVWGYVLSFLVVAVVVCVVIVTFDCKLLWGMFKNYALSNFVSVLVIAVIMWIVVFLSSMTVFRDKSYPKSVISLNNRNLYLVFSYFFYFLVLPVGCFGALWRFFMAMAIGFFMLPRIDRSVFPEGFQWFDRGYAAYIGYLHILAAHRNPVMRVFCQIVSNEIHQSSDVIRTRPPRYRNKWFLLLTLLRNPQLQQLRKHRLGPATVKFVAAGDVSVEIENPAK